MKKVTTATGALRDRYIVSIDTLQLPFICKSAVPQLLAAKNQINFVKQHDETEKSYLLKNVINIK